MMKASVRLVIIPCRRAENFLNRPALCSRGAAPVPSAGPERDAAAHVEVGPVVTEPAEANRYPWLVAV